MSGRKERTDGIEHSKSRARIGRACDRCKLKKSKCDGNSPCSSCVASDSTCEYSVRRRREARDWYWGMQDIIDEALQRLYWACREGRGFPGVVPDESGGRVPTDAILRGLGLTPPPVERLGLGTTQSDSALDGIERGSEPSYRPPDVQSDRLSRASTSSSRPTPRSVVSEDRPIMGDGVSGLDGPGLRTQRLPTQTQPGHSSVNLSHQFSDGMDGAIDPVMLQDGEMDMMSLGGAVFPEVDSLHFQPSEQTTQTDEQPPPPSSHTPMQSQSSQDVGMMSSHGSGWAIQRGLQPAGTLPWPGTLAAVYRSTKQELDGSSFHGSSPQQ
ncbi:hypothetical protein A1O1_08547 [Capronia coronata CBS 617.96]|uniref:Zn(2)-C6 fungal-type domain-containing protein n=1 Tax=Capronia coronata CBS 617.96 TaxID=1182541 RepID=W9XJQ1_9EURO|nr:uncharacterized protein A1O1_08547 [Capronia coronata CBS 617.96]EXJ80403.1 hypothetical protein A1O1_08547 [Capronia coronata CBS 617.96]